MGKSVGKLRKPTLETGGYGNPITDKEKLKLRRYCQLNHQKLLSEAETYDLLEIGERVCRSDYVVKFYYNKNHPSFYKNRDFLEHAIKRSFAFGAFNHREIILDRLMDIFSERDLEIN